MAIAVNQGHVSRALDFYKTEGKYFVIGKTSPWDDETTPDAPLPGDFRIEELVAMKKVDNCFLVVQDNENGTIVYKDSKWRIVQPEIITKLKADVAVGSTTISVESLANIVVGNKLRINNLYEGKILQIGASTNTVTLDTAAPTNIPINSIVLGGAYVEGAKYIYIECTLNYDQFPIVTYRQIGLHTNVLPNTADILRAKEYSSTGADEFSDLGKLEVLDNRAPITRYSDQSERISLILEF